ncbi:ribosomal protein L22/L17 [Sphaerosporella brunnea]|uniref:Ribosomal protein L22/L17 n=1 Tax=Sphaerosporella brunnea TaxID=1250544 RepID=A0A5J5EWF9_9PEZI|nr:ribosomal protein L22/L17 [Sphaerosporella brunnea]
MNTVRPFRLLASTRGGLAPSLSLLQQTRSISWFNWGKSKEGSSEAAATADSSTRSLADLLKQSPQAMASQQAPVRGSIAGESILGPEDAELPKTSHEIDLTANRILRDPARKDWGWLRTVAAREHRRRGRLTRQERIAQTEKEHTAASHFFKTSIKKLAPLARQIHGKSLDDAITQMRFSPKKAARDVLSHLHLVRNEAIVRKAMKPEEIYIAQAWVGRGPFERELNHRARGRIDMLQLPYTKITIQVKEQATLERIAKEKEAKRLRKPVWQQLPSRPIYGQRQYYQW